eukprot:s1130_g21.t1
METPLSFPLKDSYEQTNTTLEGLQDKERRRGDPEIPGLEYEPESPIFGGNELDSGNGDEDDDVDGGEDGHGGGAGKVSKSDVSSKPGLPPEEETYEHYKDGTPDDGKLCLNDIGELVKIDKISRPYKIGKDDRKAFRESPRPVDKHTPEEWQRLPIADRKAIKKMQQRERDRELAKSKATRETKSKSPAEKKKDPDKDGKSGEKGVFDFSMVREYDDVAREAKKNKVEVKLRFQRCGDDENEDEDGDEYEGEDEVEDEDDFDHEDQDDFDHEDEDEDEDEDEVEDGDDFDHEDEDEDEDEDEF